ncbi:hypothetical protein VM98_34350, partial [Streptomyces rubellomurinus subsp. indigoferus]
MSRIHFAARQRHAMCNSPRSQAHYKSRGGHAPGADGARVAPGTGPPARVAAGLGLPARVVDQPVGTLSGGQRRRV